VSDALSLVSSGIAAEAVNQPIRHEVLVIGAGQAGISLSFFLKKLGIDHLVLERDRPFSAWHNRWDGFYANTPNWMNCLPRETGKKLPGKSRDGFATRAELIEYFEHYLDEIDAPVLCGQNVVEVRQAVDGTWIVRAASGESFAANNVVICTGAMSKPRIPEVSESISSRITQLHSEAYRRPSDIETTRVLVVGSGSSGVQICRELLDARRFAEVHLASSNVLVLPNHILGIQIHRFLALFGLFDVRVQSRIGRMMYRNLEFKGDPIRPPTPEDLARSQGMLLHGRLSRADGEMLHFTDGSSLQGTDLTIIWSTGFKGDYAWIKTTGTPLEFDKRGYPLHWRGTVDKHPGLYFVGLRYQYTVTSHDIYGVGIDAEFIASRIQHRMLGQAEAGRRIAMHAT
jgi:putative flavoprotein involved in K+ transport